MFQHLDYVGRKVTLECVSGKDGGGERRRNANDLLRMDRVPASKAFVVRSGPHCLRNLARRRSG